MTEIIGHDIEIGLAVENNRGTAEAVAEKWLKKTTANIVDRVTHAIDDNSHGVLEDSDNRRVVQKWFDGDIPNSIADADAIGYLLYNIYGAVVSGVVTGSVYSHAFSIAQNIQHPSLSIFAKDGSVQQAVFGLGMVNTLEISASSEDYVRFTANIIAATESANADTPDYDDQYDWIGADIAIKIADTEAGLSGATAQKVKNIVIKWDQGIIRDHVLGSYNSDDNYNSKASLEIEFTKNFSDEVFKDLFNSDNSKYLQIVIAGSQDIGSGNHPTLTLVLNKAMVTAWDRKGEKDALVEETVTVKAFYNATDGEAHTLTLKNLTTEYDKPISA
ncbi:MAG: phage tail tube protein [Candidatus Komeilibacteria bacterium]|nr:phage tail tube protein [Candidatus Komeilibacteria bacterium]